MIKGVKSKKAKEELPHPTCLPFAEFFEAFEAFEAFASLHFYPYFIFSLLKRNKPIEWKIK